MFRTGDQAAFATMVERYSDSLLGYGLRFSLDEALIKDCVQDVFCYIWTKKEGLQSVRHPKLYLMKSLRHKILREMAKWNSGPQIDTLTDELTPSSFIIELEDHQQLDAILQDKLKAYVDRLSPKQKEIIYLRFYEGLKPKEIALLLHLEPQSVYNLLHTALLSLRRVIDYKSLLSIFGIGIYYLIKK